ncbi:MAG: bifunctional glutamate N-acetyltransferase/amino-acid acetyltransferase ArgJ [Actinomycetes bacterium]
MSVTAAKGFRAAGVTAGLKASGKADVALVVNDGPLDVAGAVFTSNRCAAHPVVWSRQAVSDGRARAVVLNSGGANCYTGPEGFSTTHATAELVARLLTEAGAETGAGDVLVCSTGLIGDLLDVPKLSAGVAAAAGSLSETGGSAAAEAIMTTDTRAKTAVAGDGGWTVGGMAKGAGMLASALATMLVVVATDAEIDGATADAALREATSRTFDRLDSDGCMSTNDTVVLLASGASGERPDPAAFSSRLTEVCADLAGQLLADAEGSEHDIAIEVRGAATEADALEVGRAVARSALFKTAIFGQDPNWGRVLAAVGTTGAEFDPAVLDVAFNGVQVCRDGGVGEPRDGVDLSGRDVRVVIDLKAGDEEATIWTNDLTTAYVHENSAYST